MAAPTGISGNMRAVLVSAFPEDFVRRAVLPELRRRVSLLAVLTPEKADGFDFVGNRPDVVLHMTEFGGHSASEKLSKACRMAGVTIRSLSRKKASWSFLPPPVDGELPGDDIDIPEPEEAPVDVIALESVARGRDLKAARDIANMTQRQLAEAMGVAQPLVSRAETGQRPVDEEWCRQVLAACGLPPTWRGLVKEKHMTMQVIPGPPPSAISETVLPSLAEKSWAKAANEREEVRARLEATEQELLETKTALEVAEAKIAQLASVVGALRTLQGAGVLSKEEVGEKTAMAVMGLLGSPEPGRLG